MANYSIGITGLDAARTALEIIGNNIANAATEGYHRQEIELTPAFSSSDGGVMVGGGVDIAGINRRVDTLLEQEILRQQSLLGQVSQELTTLRTIETSFGEFTTDGGLNLIIDNFFNALHDLSTHPGEVIWQDKVVNAAVAMAGQFRTLGEFLTTLDTRIQREAENIVEEINLLATQTASLNYNIHAVEVAGGQANDLRDKRDQYLTELSELIGIEVQAREFGVVDVFVGGTPLVMGKSSMEFEAILDDNNLLGISAVGGVDCNTSAEGGKLGGLLALKNVIVSDIRSKLDSLATAIIGNVNQYHLQGVGSAGSFTELTGWAVADQDLADIGSGITSGSIFFRITNTSTGAITREEIDIANDLPADPTLTDLATYITNNITGVTASITSSKLHIQADANYKFDFMPAVLSSPTESTIAAGSPPTITVSGIYTGTTNQTFTFTALGDGSVSNGTLQIQVTDGDDSVVTVLNVGSGYSKGEELDIGNGIKIALTLGDLEEDDNFKVDAFGNTDTSGLMAAVGINTFFSGTSATNITVCSEITAAPARIAIFLSADMNDNINARRMAGVKDEAITGLGSLTPGEFYRRMVTDIGQSSSVKKMREDNLEAVSQNLNNQRNELSGVDINEEAVRLLLFEQMFQAMARYINTLQKAVDSLMNVV